MNRTLQTMLVFFVVFALVIALFALFQVENLELSDLGVEGNTWLSGFQYRMSVYLDEIIASGTQVNFNVTYSDLGGYCQSDFDDLRLTDTDSELVSAYSEAVVSGSYCEVWFVSDGTDEYYLYFGNSSVSSYWSAESVFDEVLPNVVLGLTMDTYVGDTMMSNGDLEDITYENDAYSDDNGNRSLPWGIEPLAGTLFTSEFDNSVYHSGSYSLKFENLTNQYFLYYAPPEWVYKPNVSGGLIYSCSGWFKTDSLVGSGVTVRHQFWNSTQGFLGGDQKTYTLLGTNDWTKLTFSMTAPANSYKGDPILVVYGTGTVWVDDITYNCTGVPDYSGYGNNALIEGEGNETTCEPSVVSGKFGSAMAWDSTTRKAILRVKDADSLTTPETFTWASWVYLNKTVYGAGQEWATIFSKDYFWLEEWFTIFQTPDSDIRVRFNNNDFIGDGDVAVLRDSWQFVLVDYNSTHVNYYVNGTYDSSDAYALGNTNTIYDLLFSTPVTGYNWEGKIDHTVILNGTVTADEALIWYNDYGDVEIIEGSVCCRVWLDSMPSVSFGAIVEAIWL